MEFLAQAITDTATLWVILAIVGVVFILMSAILHFHWTTYAPRNAVIKRAQIIYYAVSFLLFGGAALIVAFL